MRRVSACLAMVFAAGCGGSSEPREPAGPGPSLGHPAPGGGLTVAEALRSDADPPLLVRGYVVANGNELRLCSALAESHPPQCGGPSLALEGLDVDELGALERAGSVRWTDREVALLGEVEDGLFRVSATAKA